MELTAHSQIYVFLTTLYGGVIIAFIYDIYRIFRYYIKPKRVATFIEDLIFWVIVALIALFILIFSNWGELRGYVFIGFLIGAILYNKLLSKIVITILVKLIDTLIRSIKWITKILFFPIKFIARKLNTPYQRSKRGLKRGMNKFKRKAKLPFRIFSDFKKHTKNILTKK